MRLITLAPEQNCYFLLSLKVICKFYADPDFLQADKKALEAYLITCVDPEDRYHLLRDD